jgi:predicted transposase/invertase (TIGR01784 family)
LPKFAPDKPKLLQSRFEKWLYLLKFSDLYHNLELPESLKEEEGIEMAIDRMREAYAQDEIRAVIEAQEKAKRDAISRLSFAERKGRKQGLEEGREEGRREVREETARRMLALELDLEIISQATGFSVMELERFRTPSD